MKRYGKERAKRNTGKWRWNRNRWKRIVEIENHVAMWAGILSGFNVIAMDKGPREVEYVLAHEMYDTMRLT